jgi:hypothetical protein
LVRIQPADGRGLAALCGRTISNSTGGHYDVLRLQQTMASGLEEFAQGVAVQTEKRALDEHVRVREVPAIEIAELDQFRSSLENSRKKDELAGILGLTIFVRYLYAQIQELMAKNPELSAANAFKTVIDRTNHLMFEMEEYYYDDVRPKLGIKKAIAALGPFLEERV